MARSYKYNKGFSNTGKSNKEGKKTANRIFRRSEKIAVKQEFEILPELKEAYNFYNFPGDGKHYWNNATKADLRK